MIYHITTQAEWDTAQKNGVYRAPSLESDGFIHCSFREQVLPTAERFFNGRTDLILLTINPDALACPVVTEDLYGHGAFPHIHGEILLEAVVAADADILTKVRS